MLDASVRLGTLFALLIPVVFAGCGHSVGSPGVGGGGGGGGATQDAGPLAWQPCGSAECASLTVPIDYTQPDAGSLLLAVTKVPATNPGERIGVLLFNFGGPGMETLNELAQLYPQLSNGASEIVSRFDIVGFDWRGVGQSTPAVSCGRPPRGTR